MGPGVPRISSSRTSLITSILSAGTFFGESPAIFSRLASELQLTDIRFFTGALIAGDLADRMGRRLTVSSDFSAETSAEVRN